MKTQICRFKAELAKAFAQIDAEVQPRPQSRQPSSSAPPTTPRHLGSLYTLNARAARTPRDAPPSPPTPPTSPRSFSSPRRRAAQHRRQPRLRQVQRLIQKLDSKRHSSGSARVWKRIPYERWLRVLEEKLPEYSVLWRQYASKLQATSSDGGDEPVAGDPIAYLQWLDFQVTLDDFTPPSSPPFHLHSRPFTPPSRPLPGDPRLRQVRVVRARGPLRPVPQAACAHQLSMAEVVLATSPPPIHTPPSSPSHSHPHISRRRPRQRRGRPPTGLHSALRKLDLGLSRSQLNQLVLSLGYTLGDEEVEPVEIIRGLLAAVAPATKKGSLSYSGEMPLAKGESATPISGATTKRNTSPGVGDGDSSYTLAPRLRRARRGEAAARPVMRHKADVTRSFGADGIKALQKLVRIATRLGRGAPRLTAPRSSAPPL